MAGGNDKPLDCFVADAPSNDVGEIAPHNDRGSDVCNESAPRVSGVAGISNKGQDAEARNDFRVGTCLASSYDFEALSAFAEKYLEVPLNGNTERLAAFITGLCSQ